MIKQDFLIITGQSGAGLSSTLKYLEDIGYESFDNFPLDILPDLIKKRANNQKPIALGIDTRSHLFSFDMLRDAINQLQANHQANLVFISCQDEKLQRRFSETRRPHPLAQDRPVTDGIRAENTRLGPIKNIADITIDTTDLSIHDLKRAITGMFAKREEKSLTINLLSFSYKQGIPREADLVFDVRFLKNPYWNKDLRPLTGQDLKVQNHIKEDPMFEPFTQQLKDMLLLLLPAYEQEGKHYLTIAFGCTGGKHRSVFCAHMFNEWFKEQNLEYSLTSQVQHRVIA